MATNPGHHTTPEALIGAWLQGTASRYASMRGWKGPEGADREAAIAELRATATIGRALRTDLLAQQAGVCLGASRLEEVNSPLHARMAALLLEALDGAEQELVEAWATKTYERLAATGLRDRYPKAASERARRD